MWQFTEVAVWILTLTLLLGFEPGQSAHGISYGWLVLVLLVRDALLIAIAALIIYEMWHPELDVVRSAGMDDPAGGVFNGAPDYGGAAAWRRRGRRRTEFARLLDAGASGEA